MTSDNFAFGKSSPAGTGRPPNAGSAYHSTYTEV